MAVVDRPPHSTPEESDGQDARHATGGPVTTAFSDLDLRRWKAYDDIITGTLWLLGARDKSGPHAGDYWGNFVPQIPNQILRRFTKAGDVVVDLFNGMGTTLIECRHLGRHGIGVELLPEVAARARQRIDLARNDHAVVTPVLVADSRLPETADLVRGELAKLGKAHADCIILHPPYHDIIKFSDDPRDLCNAPTVPDFLDEFEKVVSNAVGLLADAHFLALVIGDKYADSEWVPLGFYCAQVCQDHGLQLKAINVKDIQGNEKGKGQNENLWKYRALRQGFYIFKHEYVMVFRKTKRRLTPPGRRGRPRKQPAAGPAS
jgi:hypothetical protein